ncbi:MAG: cytochrome P450 [Ilumatobacteraceae bacterium]
MHTTDEALAPRRRRVRRSPRCSATPSPSPSTSERIPATTSPALVQAEVDGDRLTDGELQWFFLLLVNAGGDTTRNLLAAGLQALFDHPDQYRRLAGDMSLVPSAVEEMLRWTTPVVHFRRTVMHDLELRGARLHEGDKVMVFYGSANRDEDVFTDPDTFDVGRTPNPHLAFGGGGPHLCLGLHVARVEIQAMLREVLTRLPGLRANGDLEPMASNFIAGVHAMPVAWTLR